LLLTCIVVFSQTTALLLLISAQEIAERWANAFRAALQAERFQHSAQCVCASLIDGQLIIVGVTGF
jgi:hypothetical protein